MIQPNCRHNDSPTGSPYALVQDPSRGPIQGSRAPGIRPRDDADRKRHL